MQRNAVVTDAPLSLSRPVFRDTLIFRSLLKPETSSAISHCFFAIRPDTLEQGSPKPERGELLEHVTTSEHLMNDELRDEIKQLLDDGHKIQAVKRYQQQTGVGLAEARNAVEAVGRGDVVAAVELNSDVPQDVIALLGRGEKIAAIKLYREQTGASLKAAKEAVEKIAEENGIAMAAGSGCMGVIVLAIAVTALIVSYAQ